MAFLLFGGYEVEIVRHHLRHLGGLAAAEAVAILVVQGHRAVACRGYAGDVGPDDGDVVPPGEPRDRVVFEAMDPRCPQVGRQAELVRGPDAPADAFACLEDCDVVPIDGEVPCGRQPGDASADHQDLSRLDAHVFLSLHKLHLAWLHKRIESTFLYLMRIKREESFTPGEIDTYMTTSQATSPFRTVKLVLTR